MAPPSISTRQARRLALDAQGLIGARRKGSTLELLERLGGIQIDTISVLARSHLLVNWARLGARPVARIEGELWGHEGATFEYWSHAACVLPIAHWPYYAFKRRERRARGRRWHRLADGERSLDEIRKRLSADGPLTANGLGGAKGSGPWWDWTEQKIAVEWLLDLGEVACCMRRGFARVYDLAERCVPSELLHDDFDDDTCARFLLDVAGRALGVATVNELAAYNGLSSSLVRKNLPDSGLVEVQLENSKVTNYAHPEALARLDLRPRSRSTLLSPFDSLIWFRPRAERLFDFVQRLEAYTPAPKRTFGYYAMPILDGDRLVGRVDPKRSGETFIARHVGIDDVGDAGAAARAIREAASWIGASSIAIEKVTPTSSRSAIESELASV